MSYSPLVHVVDGVHQLEKVCPGHVGAELPAESHEVEQLASTDILEDDGEAGLGVPVAFFVCAVWPDCNQVDQILMVQLLQDG